MSILPFTIADPALRAEFDEAVQRALRGERDPEAMRKASEHMDALREENRRQHGVQNVGVDFIRELRGEIPEP